MAFVWQSSAALYCRRFWANETPNWVEGTVTDYNPTTDEHGITYYLDSGREEWESFIFA